MKKLVAFLFISLTLIACTDYETDYEDMYGKLTDGIDPSTVVKGTMTDSRDNQTYKTVTIGTQTWMAENLNYAYVQPTTELDSSSFCNENDVDFCKTFGRLYLWSAAMDSAAVFSDNGKGCGDYATCSTTDTIRGVCPEGWHLPSSKEWNTLFASVGGGSSAGTVLKSTSGWVSSGNGEDSFGFSVLPASFRYDDGNFEGGGYAGFWSSTENGSGAYGCGFGFDDVGVSEYYTGKGGAFSVRCVRNSFDEGSEASSDAGSSSSVILSGGSAEVEESSSSEISSSSIVYGTLTDSRDGQIYKTVTIGSQTWMAENLNYAYDKPTSSEDSSSFCYNNSADSCSKYGRLYLWSAAMDSAAIFSDDGKGCGYGATCSASGTVRGVCPEGWHLPSDDEWSTLFTAAGGTSSAGMVLKSTSGWYRSGNGEDSYGFSVVPAGYSSGGFSSAGYGATFWSSTEYDSNYAYNWSFYYSSAYMDEFYGFKDLAVSVRCLRNSDDEGSEASSSSSQAQPSSSSSSILAESSSSEDIVSSSSIEYGSLTDSRDNQTYKTVTIGEQTWMAENLNYAYDKPTSSEDSSSFCYNNSADSCSKYGRLYLWSAAMDSAAIFSDDGKGCGYYVTCSASGTVRGVCPEGWHLPSRTEWSTLFNAVGGTSSAGTVLKSTSGWISSGNGEDSYGFSVLPAGYRNGHGDRSIANSGDNAYFWSSTGYNSSYAYYLRFDYDSANVYEDYDYKYDAFSVRCVMD